MKQLYLICLLLFTCLTACNKEDEEFGQQEAVIVKELPDLFIRSMKDGDTRIIRTQAELEQVLQGTSYTIEELQNIDWEQNMVLLGCKASANGGTVDYYSFEKIGKKKYLLTCKYSEMRTFPVIFCYGVIVKKLPKSAKIKFNPISQQS